MGEFLGIPLDVRHVTLNTGTLALAAASFGHDWLYRGWFFRTLYGIAVTFALNLGVSFLHRRFGWNEGIRCFKSRAP